MSQSPHPDVPGGVLDALYKAAVHPTGWAEAWKVLHDYVGWKCGVLNFRNMSGAFERAVVWNGLTVDDLRQYAAVYQYSDPIAGEAMAHPLQLQLIPNIPGPGGLLYNWSSVGVPVAGGHGIFAVCHRPDADYDVESAVARIEPLLPHLARVLPVARQEMDRGQQPAISAMIELNPAAVFIITGAGQIVEMNERARSLIRSQEIVSAAQNMLQIVDPLTAASFRRLLAMRGSEVGEPVSRIMTLPSRAKGRAAFARLVVLSRPLADTGIVNTSQYDFFAFVVTGADGVFGNQRPGVEAALRSLFTLTPTEAKVAHAFLWNSSVENVAANLSLTVQAVRFHLKNIYSKTGVHGQAALVGLLTTGPLLLQ